jgi:Ca2+-binding EF-hand superfamily protein
MDEEVYHGMMEQIEQLMSAYNKIDLEKGNPGKITKEELRQGLKEIYPMIDPETIVAIISAAEIELDAKDTDEIDYQEMFKEVSFNIISIISLLQSFTFSNFNMPISDLSKKIFFFFFYLGSLFTFFVYVLNLEYVFLVLINNVTFWSELFRD